ncbi:MAG: UvrB/UvrC motif-containing protein [Phycisphaerales bacterium]
MELHERLRAAIDAENYELAAILRDELRVLRE